MKNFPSTRIFALVLLLVPFLASAQSDREKKDPFTREKSDKQKAEVGQGETIIVIGIQLARVPSTKVREWDEEGLSGGTLRKQVQNLVEEGEAKIVDSIAGTWRSGNRGKFQSALELRYPTAFEIISDSFDDPPFPMQFETRNLGIYLEADPLLDAEQNQLELNFAFEWSRYLGEVKGAREVTERMQATDILEPHYSVQKVTRQAMIPIGEYQVLTRIQPHDPEKEEGFDVIVFGRADLVVVNPIADKEAVRDVRAEKDGRGLKFRATWVEVDAEGWHRALYANSLSSWFGGKAWESVRAWEKNGKAKVLAAPTIGSRSGQRGKVEVAEALSFRDSFPAPGAAAGSNTASTKTRAIGHVLEFDPVLGENGIIHFNVSGVSTSMHGWGVSYRKKEGDQWVPAVQFPKFYGSSVATQVVLGEDSNLLVGVGTPPLESGQPDKSRKWLFFVHNDTFDTK